MCPAHTAKPYKRAANRLFRRKEREDVSAGREPHWSMKSTADPRLMAYDDKIYRVGLPKSTLRK